MRIDEVYCEDVLSGLKKLKEDKTTVDLVFTSPPYALKTKRYGEKKSMKWGEWVDWMAEVIQGCCDVCTGFVVVNSNNPVRSGEMIPANEHLVVKLFDMGMKAERPVIWWKNSCSNCRPWWVNSWEPVMAFYAGNRPQTWNWEAIATPPKYTNGGNYSQRTPNGIRRKGGKYPKNELARPRDLMRITVGGGHMGSKLAHENEAPFPENLVTPFMLALSNPGDVVLDPFCGSGTTLSVAIQNGRHFIGFDSRESQIELSNKRIQEARDIVSLRNRYEQTREIQKAAEAKGSE